MRGRAPRKRRLAVVAVVALVIAVVAPLLAPSAGATVANPGDVDVSMRLSLFTPTFTAAGMSTIGWGTATVEKNGLITIPQSSLLFEPLDSQMTLPRLDPDPSATGADGTTTPPDSSTVIVQAVAASDFTGGLDPRSGAAFLVGKIELLLSQGTALSNCPVGPFGVIVRTNTQGGVKYSAKNGTVSMVDPGITVDAVPTGAASCADFASAINTALALPVTTTTTTTVSRPPGVAAPTTTTDPLADDPPVPSVVVSLTIAPAPHAVPLPVHRPGVEPPVTQPHPTTVTPAPPSVVPPRNPTSNPSGNNNSGAGNNHRNNNGNGNNKHKKHHKIKKKPKKFVMGTIGFGVPSGKAKGGGGGGRVTPRSYASGRKAAVRPKVAAVSSADAQRLRFKTTAFIKRPQSALAIGLDLAGLVGLLVFSSLALWLVTTEVSSFSASKRRQRAHRIAGVTHSR